jgi:nucleoside-diphosphate-sugar epimerase
MAAPELTPDSPMRVLVTGATGFVGSHTAMRLLESGHGLRLLVRDRRKAEHIFGPVRLRDVELVVGDVSDLGLVREALRGCDGVVHTAAVTPVGLRPDQDLEAVNVGGVRAVVGGACEEGIESVVYVSSLKAIFHPDASRMTAEAPIAKSRLAYSRSRARAEHYVRSVQQTGAPVMIVYPGNVLGPDDPGLSSAAVALRDRITRRFTITSSGAQQIDVRDLADVVTTLIEEACGPGRFLAPGHFLSWSEMADLLERLVGRSLERVHVPGWRLRLSGRAVDWLRAFARIDSPLSAESMRHATRWPPVEPSPELAEMGVVFRTPEETFRDTLLWMCEAGHLDRVFAPGLEGVAGADR